MPGAGSDMPGAFSDMPGAGSDTPGAFSDMPEAPSDAPGSRNDRTPARSAERSRNPPRSRPSKSTLTERLEDVAIPHLKALEARLQIARHRTLLDDRLGRTPPTIRFRLIPRRGPFDDVSAVPGSALEIVADDDASVTARLWLDPVAEEPAEERSVEGARFDEAWIDEITMEFVEKALRRR